MRRSSLYEMYEHMDRFKALTLLGTLRYDPSSDEVPVEAEVTPEAPVTEKELQQLVEHFQPTTRTLVVLHLDRGWEGSCANDLGYTAYTHPGVNQLGLLTGVRNGRKEVEVYYDKSEQ